MFVSCILKSNSPIISSQDLCVGGPHKHDELVYCVGRVILKSVGLLQGHLPTSGRLLFIKYDVVDMQAVALSPQTATAITVYSIH